jgi:ABC-type nitrate/sulfonate/bicarbonate transport system permease component
MISRSNILYILCSISTILLAWWFVNVLNLVNPLFIPDITETFYSLAKNLTQTTTYYSLFLTTFRAFSGLLLAAFLGIPIGLLLAKLSTMFKFLEFPIEFFRSIPPSALFPLFILFFGIGDSSKIAVVFYACSLILLVSSYYGALPNPEKTERINMLRTFEASSFQVFYMVVIRDAIPNISAGLRVCLSYSLALVVVTEMFLGANEGLGKMIYDYYLQYRIPEMFGIIIILGITGFIINQVYIFFEKKFLFWAVK